MSLFVRFRICMLRRAIDIIDQRIVLARDAATRFLRLGREMEFEYWFAHCQNLRNRRRDYRQKMRTLRRALH